MSGGGGFAVETWEESKRIWHVAFPAILTAVFQYSIGFVTIAFCGHLGEVELAGISVAQNVVEGLAYGVLLGMGSALETLCGQAVGAGRTGMLGVYMQRSWIICGVTAVVLTPLYAFTSPILRLFHQTHPISDVAGKYARWAIPQLFAYAANFPMQKFFQSQSKVWAMTLASGLALAVHAVLNWGFVSKLRYGVVAAAIVGNVTWWMLNIFQFAYLISGSFPEAWKGFSGQAFKNLKEFVKLSLASAVMLCLELWYYTAIIILVGLLKNAEIEVGVISICMNFQLWTLMIALGFNVAVSVRVSNELGANRPKAAKFSVIITTATSGFIGLVLLVIFIVWRKQLPRIFNDDPRVIKETSDLGYLLAASIFLNSIQPVFSGVAIGAGWQALVAVINIAFYYGIGLPLGAVLGFKLKLRGMGIWIGMTVGTLIQTGVLLLIIIRTQWEKQAMLAEERINTWGGRVDLRTASLRIRSGRIEPEHNLTGESSSRSQEV